jgi:CRP/FNR family transcriptional regulator
LTRKHAALRSDASNVEATVPDGGTKLTVEKRQLLFRAHEPAISIYEIATGALMVYRLLADGRRQIIDLALPGSVCGVTRGPLHECSCEALLPSTLIAYDRRSLTSNEETAARLSHKMEQQICTLAEHIVLLGRRTTEERLAAFLVRCAQTWKTASDEKATAFRIPMTRVEIGDYLGMSLETVSRGIADFERRGLISTAGRQGEMRVWDIGALASAWSSQRKIRKPSS